MEQDSSLHDVLHVVLLGVSLVTEKLLIHAHIRCVTTGLGLLDTVAVVLLVLVVIGVIL